MNDQPPQSTQLPGSESLARHRVRDGVERLILSGHYRPGQRLVQQELAARFGVAQTVVRESLLELQFYGLVQAVDNLGMFVSGLDAQTILDAYEIREALEGLAARRCCEMASRADLRELIDLSQRARQSGQEGKLAEMSALDRQFHSRITRAAQNRLLSRLTESYRVLGMFVRAYRAMDEVHQEHVGIVTAIEANRPDEAEALARRHVQAARQSIQRQVAENTFVLCPVGDAEEEKEAGKRQDSRKKGAPS